MEISMQPNLPEDCSDAVDLRASPLATSERSFTADTAAPLR